MTASITSFESFGLSKDLLDGITALGYEAATPVQEKSIPILMKGTDLVAQAQTGTGKTAAFALPILANLDVEINSPQALVIAPTRELAIQVAEAFRSYAKNLKGLNVCAIYGGQDYQVQLRALKRGTHVIVGTPGRMMDHMRRGTLSVKTLKTVVLDEADEMLNMGFVDDIEWILGEIPHAHQTALFSATIPASIKKMAKKYLQDPETIAIASKTRTVDLIEQLYTLVPNHQKLEALTRFLEVEEITAAIVFTRTKNISAELSEKLQARGYAAAALNGDMSQSLREKVVGRLKRGSLDIVVATDVAARGIDVERLSHVINYDIPSDVESYVHRIGRTGRAGRQGKAILFVSPREQRLLKDIERFIGQTIKLIEPPSLKEMNEKRAKQLGEKVINIINKSKKLALYHGLVEHILGQGQGLFAEKDIAAALAYLLQEANPLPDKEVNFNARDENSTRGKNKNSKSSRGRSYGRGDDSGSRGGYGGNKPRSYGKSSEGDRGNKSRSYGKSSEGDRGGYGGNKSRSDGKSSEGDRGGYDGNRSRSRGDSSGGQGGYDGNRSRSRGDSSGGQGGYDGNRSRSRGDSSGGQGGYDGNRSRSRGDSSGGQGGYDGNRSRSRGDSSGGQGGYDGNRSRSRGDSSGGQGGYDGNRSRSRGDSSGGQGGYDGNRSRSRGDSSGGQGGYDGNKSRSRGDSSGGQGGYDGNKSRSRGDSSGGQGGYDGNRSRSRGDSSGGQGGYDGNKSRSRGNASDNYVGSKQKSNRKAPNDISSKIYRKKKQSLNDALSKLVGQDSSKGTGPNKNKIMHKKKDSESVSS